MIHESINTLGGQHFRAMLLAVAFGLILVEYLFRRLDHDDSYDARETATSLVIALGNKLIGGMMTAVLALPLVFVYQHRLFDIPLDNVWWWLALFVAIEFSYYVHHVAMHKIRWFWATHSVHHSATKMNLSAAVRLGWGGNLTGGFLFYLPLIYLGFNPAAVLLVLGLGLFYQFFLHSAFVPNLGPLEWIFNTPRHHHVHHASNSECLDRNFGSVLIVFDRMFGTFASAPQGEALRFGLAGIRPTANPVSILFGEWFRIARDVVLAGNFRARLRALFGPPV
ncbi:MAG: sterol desaturase family protein [Bradyrhizobiaceae bacterium]|nr:MAG: sterol desaturase family protein [Bradyrhizobiaceae bacterium]